MARRDPREPGAQIIAHRGASGSKPENSLAAFHHARVLGADAVELDIHATRDGVLLVHHDAVVPGIGLIPHHSAAELSRYRLANGEALPTLSAALDAATGLDVWVEVKTLPPSSDSVLLELLDRGPTPECYAVHGFDHRIITRLGRLRPALKRGALLASYLVDTVAAVRETGAATVWQESHLIDELLVQTLHLSGLSVVAWTVNDDAEAARLIGIGVDGLCGNFPDRLLSVRLEYAG